MITAKVRRRAVRIDFAVNQAMLTSTTHESSVRLIYTVCAAQCPLSPTIPCVCRRLSISLPRRSAHYSLIHVTDNLHEAPGKWVCTCISTLLPRCQAWGTSFLGCLCSDLHMTRREKRRDIVCHFVWVRNRSFGQNQDEGKKKKKPLSFTASLGHWTDKRCLDAFSFNKLFFFQLFAVISVADEQMYKFVHKCDFFL